MQISRVLLAIAALAASGFVAAIYRAYLLLLRANPLDNVEAYNTIETVFLAGRAIPRETLASAPQN